MLQCHGAGQVIKLVDARYHVLLMPTSYKPRETVEKGVLSSTCLSDLRVCIEITEISAFHCRRRGSFYQRRFDNAKTRVGGGDDLTLASVCYPDDNSKN